MRLHITPPPSLISHIYIEIDTYTSRIPLFPTTAVDLKPCCRQYYYIGPILLSKVSSAGSMQIWQRYAITHGDKTYYNAL